MIRTRVSERQVSLDEDGTLELSLAGLICGSSVFILGLKSFLNKDCLARFLLFAEGGEEMVAEKITLYGSQIFSIQLCI